MAADSYSLTYFEPQKIPFSLKDTQWRENCVDGVINICYAISQTRRSPIKTKLRNYNLYNNKIDPADLDYVLNPYNLSKEKLKNYSFPASMQPYDIVSPYFQLLLGEESKRLFQPLVVAINEDSTSEKQNQKKTEILSFLEQMLVEAVQNPEQEPDFSELEQFKNYSPKMMREHVATQLLNYLYRKEHLDKTFNDCFKDVLLAGEEIIRVDKIGDGVRVKRVNPVEIWYQLPNNSDLLDEAEKIYERNQMTVSDIVDEFYEYLTPAQIDELESFGDGSTTRYNFNNSIFSIPEVDSIFAFESHYTQKGITVHRVRWKSKKQIGSWHFIDEQGQPQEVIVEEGFKAPKGTKVEWFWVSEYWEGVRLGQDMYLHKLIRPREYQLRSIDNLSECRSGYVGTIYSATNSTSVSLMDRLVPWIYLYFIIWYRTELAIAKNLGKLAFVDLSLIPDDWEFEKWIYYAHAMGFGFVNPFNESLKGTAAGQYANQSTQNRGIDLETGNYIQGHIELLRFIEERIQRTSGITEQRLGSISASELVGNTERAVTQSSHITEPYFSPHEYFKRRVCETMLEVAKECIKHGSKSFQYVTDDLATVLFTVEAEEFRGTDYGIFVTNSQKDQESLQIYKSLLQSAIQNEKIDLSTAAKTLSSLSMSDIAARLEEGEEVSQQRMQQAQQQEAGIEQAKLALEKEKLDREDNNKQLDRENQIQIAEIKAIGMDSMGEEGDQSQMIVEQTKLALEQSKIEHQRISEERKAKLEKEKLNKETERTQADMKMQDKEHKHERMLAKEEAANKLKIEVIKARAARAKAAQAKNKAKKK